MTPKFAPPKSELFGCMCIAQRIMRMRGGGFYVYEAFKFAQPKSEPFRSRCIAHRMYTLRGGLFA